MIFSFEPDVAAADEIIAPGAGAPPAAVETAASGTMAALSSKATSDDAVKPAGADGMDEDG